MSRKICVVTGTRAEYGLLRWVMQGIKDAPDLTLQIIATGMHLAPQYGETWREIEADGFTIDRKVDMSLSANTPIGITKSMGQCMIGFADALFDLQPDILVVLGDRFEILSVVSSALVALIPVAHLHGGETTEGAIDEAIRHAITKMSHLHFVAAAEYQQRVIQMGENPDRVFLVGGLGIDNIKRLKFLDREQLERSLDFDLGKRSLLITFHPATLERDSAKTQMTELLAALEMEKDTQLIFTMPNADAESSEIIKLIESFVAVHDNARVYTSLGQLRYLSCIKHVDGVIGNSSSGLAEVPSFNKGTINIGDRQKGRLKAKSVIDCKPDRADIGSALQQLRSPAFQRMLPHVKNPYGEGGASEKVVAVLRTRPLEKLLKKPFFDIRPIGHEQLK
ncbi:MAG: UDP-N-acetylglucosamine 2-epimerase [Candidatus Berkelbacteria bacterium]|nr:UDP-N-acetylglucosamine 2-epimerase [Candidatus Berkelbacteria bacterium]